MTTVNLHDFKSHLSTYTCKVKAGETVIVCERNVPIAELRALSNRTKSSRPAPGLFRDQLVVTEAFFESDREIESDFGR
jgi:antitoxin (DNA-binding transcriptional repressor) of toxin-antitoxin stability system